MRTASVSAIIAVSNILGGRIFQSTESAGHARVPNSVRLRYGVRVRGIFKNRLERQRFNETRKIRKMPRY